MDDISIQTAGTGPYKEDRPVHENIAIQHLSDRIASLYRRVAGSFTVP